MPRVVFWALVPIAVVVLAESARAQTPSPDPRVRLREGVKRDDLDAEARKTHDAVVNATTPYSRGLPAPIGRTSSTWSNTEKAWRAWARKTRW